MSMLPISPDNLLIGTNVYHSNHMTNIHIPMLTQIERILGRLEMRPFVTIILVNKKAFLIITSIYPDVCYNENIIFYDPKEISSKKFQVKLRGMIFLLFSFYYTQKEMCIDK